jgi:hypothetical protein
MKSVDRRVVGLAVAGLAILILSVCGGDSPAPSTPSSPGVPVEPTPTPTPEPTPEPGLSMSCQELPPAQSTVDCSPEVARFQDQVDSAIRTLQAEQPDLFDSDNIVQSVGRYYVGLIEILDRDGLCAYFDGEELAVTDSADYNDQYDILTSRLGARIGNNTYRVTCYPSAIPPPEAPLPPSPPGCSLPPSREVACSREAEGKFYNQVEEAIGYVLENRPELFDFNDVATRTDWPRILDLVAYHDAVVDYLVGLGFCAKRDRLEEIAVKNENERSEQYDIQLQDKYVRRGFGIYRSSCYPAAF